MEKLGQANFVPIIGASGSGKSSVVRAGLIPQLEKNGWRVLEPILPGVEPCACGEVVGGRGCKFAAIASATIPSSKTLEQR